MTVDRPLLPIACTLSPSAGAAQIAAWQAFNADHLLGIERNAGRISVRYANMGDAAGRLAALVRTEQTCCAFARWTIDTAGDDIRLTVTGAADGIASLTFFGRR
jgi:hypothetical protein